MCRATRLPLEKPPVFKITKQSVYKSRGTSNLVTIVRCIELPEAMTDCCLTTLQLKLIKTLEDYTLD